MSIGPDWVLDNLPRLGPRPRRSPAGEPALGRFLAGSVRLPHSTYRTSLLKPRYLIRLTPTIASECTQFLSAFSVPVKRRWPPAVLLSSMGCPASRLNRRRSPAELVRPPPTAVKYWHANCSADPC